MISGDDVLDSHLKLFAMSPCLRGHILQPADDCHAVGRVVAIVNETCTSVFHRIVGQDCSRNGAANDRLRISDSNRASSILHFAHLNGRSIVECQHVSILLLGPANNVPHLIIIDDMLLGETYQPVARR